MFSIENHGEIAQLAMAHGAVNAMDIEFCLGLVQALDRLAEGQCQAALLTGLDRAFSAGVDLKCWLREGPEYVVPFLDALEDTFLRIFTFPKPLIGVVAGPAIAGGCMLAAACDYRLIAPEARIGIPELRIGVPLPMTAIEIVRSVAHPTAFRRIVQVGATFTGAAAVEVGLADEVVPRAQILKRGLEVAQEYLTIPLATFQLTKRQVRDPVMRLAAANRERFGHDYQTLWQSPETRRAVEEYVRERLG